MALTVYSDYILSRPNWKVWNQIIWEWKCNIYKHVRIKQLNISQLLFNLEIISSGNRHNFLLYRLTMFKQ